MTQTYEQNLIAVVGERLADGDQTVTGELLGVTQGSISRYLSGKRPAPLAVVLLAEILLVTCGAAWGGVVDRKQRNGIEKRIQGARA